MWRRRHYLDLDSAKLLANALVCSHLNYCNSFLSGIADTDITELQHILALIVTMSPPYTHSIPLLWCRRRYLDLDSAKLLATALVCSHLDYCNSLLSGIANTDVTKLQHIQNRLALIVTMSPPYTRGVPLLHCFHWFPVKFIILFKISLLTYKILREKQPVYLHSMLAPTLASHSMRSDKPITVSP